MLALAFSAAIAGIDAHVVRVETDSAAGIPHFAIVGLPDRALNESRERIRAALVNSGFGFPPGRLLANLAPADMRKTGVGFDLAIALALLATDEQLAAGTLGDYVACGELALDGSLRAVPGVLAMTLAAKRAGFARILVPEANLAEAALVDGIDVYAVPTLCDAVAVALGHGAKFRRRGTTVLDTSDRAACGDFADVKGQTVAKRALEIAAAGGHNVVLVGPPGCGKTMLARRLPSILPAMTTAEALDVTKVYSVAGLLGARPRVIATRPFRAPHHTASRVSLVGGGVNYTSLRHYTGVSATATQVNATEKQAGLSLASASPAYDSAIAAVSLSRSPNAITDRARAGAEPLHADRYWRAGQLDWIRGFAPSDGPEPRIELVYSPIIRCLSAAKPHGKTRATKLRLGARDLISESADISALGRLEPGSCYYLGKRVPLPVAMDSYSSQPPSIIRSELSSCDIEIPTHSTGLHFLGSWDTPKLVSPLHGYISLPQHVAIFVAYNWPRTVVIPCASIVQSCYLPSIRHLSRWLTQPGPEGSFSQGKVFYNGFGFFDADEPTAKWFPTRASRDRALAEHEISQLLPRALTYAANNHGVLPFIIRPPMTGRVRVRGAAVVHRYRGSSDEIVLFLGRVHFSPANKVDKMGYLDNIVAERIAFSPRFRYGDPELPGIHAQVPLFSNSDSDDPAEESAEGQSAD